MLWAVTPTGQCRPQSACNPSPRHGHLLPQPLEPALPPPSSPSLHHHRGLESPCPFPRVRPTGLPWAGSGTTRALSWPLAVPQLSLQVRRQPQGLSCAVGVGPARCPRTPGLPRWPCPTCTAPSLSPGHLCGPAEAGGGGTMPATRPGPCQQQVQRVQALSGHHARSSPRRPRVPST